MAPESRAGLVLGSGQDGTLKPKGGGVSHSPDGSPQSPHGTADLRISPRGNLYTEHEALRADALGRATELYLP